MNKLQKFQKYVIYIFLIILIIVNAGLITNSLVRTNIESIESLSVSDCTHNTHTIQDYFKNNDQLTSLNIGYKEISIYPDISNLKCIGKLYDSYAVGLNTAVFCKVNKYNKLTLYKKIYIQPENIMRVKLSVFLDYYLR